MQSLVTNLLQKHWVWHEITEELYVPGPFKYSTTYVASLHVKTAFNVTALGSGGVSSCMDGEAWTLCGSIDGGNQPCQRKCMPRKLRD